MSVSLATNACRRAYAWEGRNMGEAIRVVIIHRKRLLREGLTFALSQQPNIIVVGSVAKASEILGDLDGLRPKVILIDFSLPERDGLGEARLIRKASSGVQILMMGLTELESDVLACIEAGAVGYLPQEASLADLLNNIQAVAAGEAFCSPRVAGFLFSWIAEGIRARERLQTLGLVHLTHREREIVALIEEGLSNKDIAVRLRIELQTVKNHVHNVLEKFQFHSRREVAQYAREQGLSSWTKLISYFPTADPQFLRGTV
jgi:two-component system nitrate/nitrite response regulator NarL